ncbi:MAG: S8 family serine peptidase, partial [Gemmatimonadota bacterium]|nr:S8 family serine peptidase [Gemmatimonadota bacterium]
LAAGEARARLFAEVVGGPLTLDARHSRLVEGLRGLHADAYARSADALAEARSAGRVREIDRLWIVNAVVAEMDGGAVRALESHPAIAEVVPDRRLTLGADPRGPGRRSVVRAVDPSEVVAFLNVPEAWASGVTGKGVIVANTDTGVNGEDSTLGDRWRGYFAGSDASWYAPIPLTVFPVDDGSIGGFGHGTATMGLLTGGEASYGVAYEATWIAGDVFESDEGFVSNALRTLQWLADPDGDPTTTSDVPDVVSNSYGLTDVDPTTNRIRCDPIFDDAIDALEAAGAIVVWSAGNEGTRGVTSPANRADSPVNAFAVGGVTLDGQPVPSSGQGPSACGGATKPEVVAPGQGVLTRNRFDQFIRLTGTSFATPMVGGVLALMRSKNPTITPEAAKTILLETARDLSTPGDDNATGRGLVDAAAALASVQRPSQPLARLVGYRPPDAPGKLGGAALEQSLILRPGGSHTLRPLLSNHGPAIGSTQATLSSPTPGVTFTRAVIPLTAAATGAFFGPDGGDAFGVSLDPAVPPGTPIVLNLTISGAPIGPFKMVVPAGEPVPGDFATHDLGRVRMTVTNFGSAGYYTGLHSGGFDLEGEGFRFPSGSPSWLFHGGFMAGTSDQRLSDAIPYGEDTQTASDWIPEWGFPIAVEAAAGGQRITTLYDDRKAPEPLGLKVRQSSYAFADPGEDAFVLLQYEVTNTTSRSLGGLRFGFFADWDLPGAGGDPAETADWDPQRRLGSVSGASDQPRLGVVWLDDVPLGQITYRVLERDEILASDEGNPLAGRTPELARAPGIFEGEFSDAEKWDALTSGQSKTSVGEPQDLWQVIGVGPVTLASGATDTVAVALVAGHSSAELEAAAETARETYFTRVLGVDPPAPPDAPDDLALLQNFPNPFRAGESTTIRFDVPEAAAASTRSLDLGVYDVTGRRVTTLRSGDASAGEQAVSWDGTDATGRPVPAGVYVIRLVAGGHERSVRALVLP